jgi:nucleotide-binding universal stress UspA family protein
MGMGTFHRILCPIDFSDASRRALLHALDIARRHGSGITALHVQSAFALAAEVETGLYVNVLPSAQDALVDFVAKTVNDTHDDVSMVSTTGDVVETIIGEAEREESDLIVMGTHGRSGVTRVLLGSVTERVLREAPCPVMTIPSRAATPTHGKEERIGTILCPTDFSRSGGTALKLALSITEQTDARLILLHVLQWPAFAGGTLPPPVVAEINADAADWEREALATLEDGLPHDARSGRRHTAMVLPGRPSQTILRIAQEEHAGLIVMGVQSRGTIDRLLFGSTTREVIQAAQCPVLSIRADKNARPWMLAADIAQLRVGA